MANHIDLIGRYYNTFLNATYNDIFNYRINNYQDVSMCRYDYLSQNTFYTVTYNPLVIIISISSSIKNTSNLDSVLFKNIMISPFVVSSKNTVKTEFINKISFSSSIKNDSNIVCKLVNQTTIGSFIKNNSKAGVDAFSKKYISTNIKIYSKVDANIDNYYKRNSKEYLKFYLNKKYKIEVTL